MIQISQRIKKALLVGVFAISQLLFSSCSPKKEEPVRNLDVVIEIECDEHIRTTSNNPQIVKKGENAEFALSFDDNFKFDYASDGVFDENSSILSIGSNDGNKSVEVRSVNTSGYTLKVFNDDSLGSLKLTPNKEFYLPGEEVELEVEQTGKDFLCYTYDMMYRNGPHGISAVPFSFDRKTTIRIEKDTVVYANYFEDNSKVIDYDLNGGLTTGGYDVIHTDYIHYDEEYLSPNAINLSNYVRRDGYILESLNTKKDGTGTRIGIGSRINNSLFTNERIALYAQWVLCNDESYFATNDVNEKEVEIVSSNGINYPVLAIPSSINNKKVVGIKANAFNNVSNVTDLYLPDTLEYIEDGAFLGMSSLKYLHLFSSIERVSKESFDAPNLESIYLNKNTYPLNSETAHDNLSAYKDTIKGLDKTKSNVLAIGHSTIRQNHDLSPLNEAYGDNYNFFIYGAAAGIDEYLLIASVMDILRGNDYVIIPVWPLIENNVISPRNLAFIQYDFDCLLNAEYSYIKDFIWESLVKYRELCTNEIGVNAYQIESHNIINFNATGGFYAGEETDNPTNGEGQDYDFYLQNIDIAKYSYLHRIFEKMNIATDHVLLTWNTYNANCFSDGYLGFSQYENLFRNEFPDCSYFDTQLDNVYPGNYFLKNDYTHLTAFGGQKRIERWVTQLAPFFGNNS